MKILTNEQSELLRIFSELKNSKKFYFTGGTALSEFYLQHRFSLDIDLFAFYHYRRNEKELLIDTAEELLNSLSVENYKTEIVKKHQFFINLQLTKGNKTFYLNLCFDTAPLLNKPKLTEYKIYLVSFEDLAAAKLNTLLERLEDRDVVDFYFISKKISVEKSIDYVKKRWQNIDEYNIAVTFSRIENILSVRSPVFELLLKKANAEKIKKFYLETSTEILRKIKKNYQEKNEK